MTNKVQDEFNQIMMGAGWATDDYVENFMDELNSDEKKELCIELSKRGLLVDEEKWSGEESIDDIPKSELIKVVRKN